MCCLLCVAATKHAGDTGAPFLAHMGTPECYQMFLRFQKEINFNLLFITSETWKKELEVLLS